MPEDFVIEEFDPRDTAPEGDPEHDCTGDEPTGGEGEDD